MDSEERQFLLTTAWMFAHHGQGERARTLCAALVEDDPRDGVAAAALAERQVEDGEPAAALETLRVANFEGELVRAAAMLETRALTMLGRRSEAERRWQRYVQSSKGSSRTWIG